MRVDTQSNTERTQLGHLLKGFSVAMMTSANGHGALVSRPMAALEMDARGALWFFTPAHAANARHPRRINLSFSDKSGATYVSLSGIAEVKLDRERSHRLWTPLGQDWLPEGSGPSDVALLRFVPQMAEYWDTANHKMVRLFAMPASVVGGGPGAPRAHDEVGDTGSPASAKTADELTW